MNVSVITTAYKHEKTINRAIDSVLAQTLSVEHHIIDDTETENGMMATFKAGFDMCKGDYIAFADADDYWIDKEKLARQVEFMEWNRKVGICTTKVFTEVDGVRHKMSDNVDSINRNMSFDTLLKGQGNLFAQSYLIRKSDFDKYIDFDKFVRLGFSTWDLPICLELIRHTRIHCMDFYSAVYSKNKESVTNTRNRSRRLKYKLGSYKIILHFIKKYGCKPSTIAYLIYKFTRDMYSIIFARW